MDDLKERQLRVTKERWIKPKIRHEFLLAAITIELSALIQSY